MEGHCASGWKRRTLPLQGQEAEVAQREEDSHRGAVMEEAKHLYLISTQTEFAV